MKKKLFVVLALLAMSVALTGCDTAACLDGDDWQCALG